MHNNSWIGTLRCKSHVSLTLHGSHILHISAWLKKQKNITRMTADLLINDEGQMKTMKMTYRMKKWLKGLRGY